VLGNDTVLQGWENGEPVDKIIAGYQPGLDQFAKEREKYLLYH
jgi:hypothetical protein